MEWEDIVELGPECHEWFLTQPDIPELSPQNIRMAGVSRLRQTYVVSRREPEHHTLLFSVRGEGRLTTVAGEAAIGPNSLTILPAGAPFRFEIHGRFWDMGWMLFNKSQQWRRLEPMAQGVRPCRQSVPLYHLFSILHHEIEGGEQARAVVLKQIMGYLNLALKDTDSRHRLRQVELLFAQLEERLHYPWTVQEMADVLFHSSFSSSVRASLWPKPHPTNHSIANGAGQAIANRNRLAGDGDCWPSRVSRPL